MKFQQKLNPFFPVLLPQSLLIQMSQQKYTREYLINLPIQLRKQHVQQSCQDKIHAVLHEARSGKTSCMVPIPEAPAPSRGIIMHGQNQWNSTPPTKDEIAELLKEAFPDCKITYEEDWVETSPGKKELKKGIKVDWS
jgi:hypothetical protein